MAHRLALGTVQFGLPYGVANQSGQVGREEAAAILRHAHSAGLTTLDTAIAYGESEQRLGEIGVPQWQIISKLPPMPEACGDVAGWAGNLIAESLQRLRVERLHGILLHRPQQLAGPDGAALYAALIDLKQAGVVEKIGISIYDPQELENLTPRYRFDIVQSPLNVLDRRLVTSGWLTRLKQAGTEVHVRSVFLQGLLLMDAAKRPARFNQWQPLWNAWDAWLDRSRLLPLQACLGFALAHGGIDRVLVGVDTVKQLQEILSAANADVPAPPADLHSEDADLINPSRWN